MSGANAKRGDTVLNLSTLKTGVVTGYTNSGRVIVGPYGERWERWNIEVLSSEVQINQQEPPMAAAQQETEQAIEALTDTLTLHQAVLEKLVTNEQETRSGVEDVVRQIDDVLQEFDTRLDFLRDIIQDDVLDWSDAEFEEAYTDFVEDREAARERAANAIEDISLEDLEAALSALLADIGLDTIGSNYFEGDEGDDIGQVGPNPFAELDEFLASIPASEADCDCEICASYPPADNAEQGEPAV